MAPLRFTHAIGYFLISLFVIIASPATAQDSETGVKRDTNFLFGWKFGNNFLSTNLPACETRPISVFARNHTPNERGTGPYFLLAIRPDGTPRRYEIGDDPDTLQWTPDFPIDAKVLLSVVDRNGGAGGVGGILQKDNGLYTISDGANSDCIKSNDPPTFKASSVVHGSLSVCDEWPIEIVGGVPPYTLTLLQPTSPNITNVTMSMNEDAFVYINRATTGQLLAVAVSDATREFAFGTPSVMVTGSTDPESCQGGSRATTIDTLAAERQQRAQSAQSASEKNQVAVGVGVTFALLVPLTLAALYWFLRRRGKLPAMLGRRAKGDLVLASEMGEAGEPTWNPPTAPLSIVPPRTQPGVTPFELSARDVGSNAASPSTSIRRTHPFPVSDAARAKAEESAAARRQNSYNSTAFSPFGPTGPDQPPDISRRQQSIVYQHVDGGEIRELPPPYADRSQRPPQDQDVLVGSTSTHVPAPISATQPSVSPFYSPADDLPPPTPSLPQTTLEKS